MDNVIRQSADPCIIFKPSFVTPRTPPPTRPPLYRSLGDDDTVHPEPTSRLSEPRAVSDSSINHACDRLAESNDHGSQLTETKRCDEVDSELEESRPGGFGMTTQDVGEQDNDRQTISSTVSRPLLHSGIGVRTQRSSDLGGINAGMGFF
jgi:hypothetical protein